MKSRIILVGPTCSGKNFLRQKFVEKGFSHDVSYTTREPRAGEFDGIDYHFLTNDEFSHKYENKHFYESIRYGNVAYGTGLLEWNARDIFIMETKGVSSITPSDRKNCLVIYINPPKSFRINRMKNDRGWDKHKILERIKIDEENFKDFVDYDMILTNADF